MLGRKVFAGMTEEQHRAHQRLISTLPVRNCGDGDEPENWAAEDIELSPQERDDQISGSKASVNGVDKPDRSGITPADAAPTEPVKALRDEFAMAALQGQMGATKSSSQYGVYAADADRWAAQAYVFADAMLAARGRK